MSRDIRTQVLEELDVCAKLLAVWLILKGGHMAGRITARYAKSGGATYVTLQLLGWSCKDGMPIYGHERMSGWGYNRTETGISEILTQNRERLKEECGIELTGHDWELQGNWEREMTAAGYEVIRVI